ncbi:hypothetical protein PTTG_30956, partial [Puccinia triticina 1-1 BBBD Race 1]|uniref:Retrovirus-related Pol polyprotein from transposon TNT 1-94-like beta-barrel domain-containing protein n=2 Tax=Puccinia triticina (isolate 1-1 / race 1 (BBBD)) TaxID=630390 RepID=A0ABL7D7A8_PUCT1
MDKSITDVRHAFQHLHEVGCKKFGTDALHSMAVIYALRRLPPPFNTFRTLQFGSFKDDKNPDMEDFLRAVEVEVRRQHEAQVQQASAATALAVSQLTNPSSDPSKKKSRRAYCSNGRHNPDATHPESECWQLHDDKAIAFHQAAIDRMKAKSQARASLGTKSNFQDILILDSGASGHFLKNRAYFSSLSTTTSLVYGANGAAIPILGFGPAVIQTAIGPLKLNLAYYAPQL